MYLYANRYERIKNLGRGTAGRVILVKDLKTSLLCALKMLRVPYGASLQRILDCFKGEFEILKNFNHPSIAHVYDAGIHEDDESTAKKKFYIVTEFVDGQDLFEATDNQPIEAVEDLLIQSLRALNYLHSQNVFHFDIKPQNMMVTQGAQGEPFLKIIDFGMANIFSRDIFTQNEGERRFVAGTTAYVAPEIIRGDSYDGRSDLYSLGCTFFKAFTRELPFSGEPDQVEHMHLHDTPRTPSSINQLVPEYVDRVILRLLEKNPAKRYQSAQAVIEDINLLSGKTYQVETPQTLVSYLPERGQLLGRDAEFSVFQKLLEDRLFNRTYTKKPYLIVTGRAGMGKTRFLQECKNEAQRHFIKTMSWAESGKLNSGDFTDPCLLIGDDVIFDNYDLDYLQVFFETMPVFTVLSVAEVTIPIDPENIIELKSFTREQTLDYVVRATGIVKIPEEVLDTIHRLTQGNPAYLAGYIRALFERGFFKDSEGSWSKELLEDFAHELERTGADAFIKKRLIEQLEKLDLDEASCELLNILALTGKPTLEDLSEMTDAHVIDDNLKILVKNGVLEVNFEDCYIFSNPLYRDIFMERIPPAEKAELCDRIAAHYESLGGHQDKVLYFKGRGRTSQANEALLQLAWQKRRSAFYQEAIDNLLLLLSRSEAEASVRENALLEAGEILTEMGRYFEAEAYFAELIARAQTDPTDPTVLQTLEQMGVCCMRMGQPERATSYLTQALESVKNKPDLRWIELRIKNRLAQMEWDLGHVDTAEAAFKETWRIWKDELDENEKLMVSGNNLDTIFYVKGEHRQAIQMLEELLAVFKNKPYSDVYPIKMYALARQYSKVGEIKKAEALLIECMEMMKDRSMYSWLAAVYNELGNLYTSLGDHSSALVNYQHAFEVSKKKPARSDACMIAFNIANIHLDDKHSDEAKKYFTFVVRTLHAQGDSHETAADYQLFMSLLGLATIHRQCHDLEKALECFESAQEIFKRKDYLKVAEQYLWQEKADLEKYRGRNEEVENSFRQLERIRQSEGFDQQNYDLWLIGHKAQQSRLPPTP